MFSNLKNECIQINDDSEKIQKPLYHGISYNVVSIFIIKIFLIKPICPLIWVKKLFEHKRLFLKHTYTKYKLGIIYSVTQLTYN